MPLKEEQESGLSYVPAGWSLHQNVSFQVLLSLFYCCTPTTENSASPGISLLKLCQTNS